MSPPTVDLSLPTNDQLLGAATPNPETEAARVTATGNPAQIADVGARLQRAGSDLDQVHSQSTRTQSVLAGGFANNGEPVYDPQTHRQLLPPGFPDAGTRLHDAGRRVTAVADELGSAITAVNAAQSRTWQLVDSRRRSFAAEVQGTQGPGGLIPEAQIAALQARRTAVAGEMQQLVNTCGRDVVTRVGRYQTVLEGCQRLLGELGIPGALGAGGRPGIPGVTLEGQPGQILGTTVPGPGSPAPNIFPLPPRLPGEPGFTPTPGGPSILINVPAPDLGSNVQDGPGSGQREDEPRIRIDTDSPTGPTGGFTGPVSGGRPHQGNFPRTAEPGDILVRTGNDGKVNSYEVYGPDGLPVKRVDVRGRSHGDIPTPHVIDFVKDTNPGTGQVFVRPGSVRTAAPDEVAGLE